MSAFAQRPPRVSLTNMVSGETLIAQYNPNQLVEKFGASYERLTVHGLSHKVKQFSNTDDATLNFGIEWDAIELGSDGNQVLLNVRRWFKASVHPRAGAGAIKTAGGPRILFIWPALMSLTCVITSAEVTYASFSVSTGGPTRLSVACTLEEIRDALVTMEDVLDSDDTATSTVLRGGGL